MAKEKGKNILTAPPMNTSSRLWPSGEPHGCDGDDCASDLNIWPLHHSYRHGERRRRLCSSCIILSQRSVYCCCCFLLVTTTSSEYDHDDPLMAPPFPTVTCHVCRDAVAHLDCLSPAAAEGIFVCPACTAAEEGRLFTYAPPCGKPLDVRDSRVTLLAARMALALMLREAAAARAEAELKSRVADEAQRRASRALSVAMEMDKQEPPEEGTEKNIVDTPQPPMDHMAASGEGSLAIVEDTLMVHRNGMAPMVALTMGTGCATAAVAMAPADAESSHTSPWPWSLPPFGANEITMATTGSSMANPSPPRTLDLFGVKEMAMAAAEAARNTSPPALRTLDLFPADEASISSKMPRTLQLFDDDDDEM